MNGNDIETLTKIVNQIDNVYLFEQEDIINFNYNLQLNLNFKINIGNKEDNYIYNPKSAFITSHKDSLNAKIYSLADKLRDKLQNQELDSKKIIDNVLNKVADNYQQSFSNELNNVLKDKSIKIQKSANMEINREQLSFELDIKNKDKNNYINTNNFSELINSKTSITISEQIFNNPKNPFYQFNRDNIKIEGDKIFTNIFEKFTVINWSIEGIDLPERVLNNIKIYHKKKDIQSSWNNFFEIIREYFNSNFKLIDAQDFSILLSWVKSYDELSSKTIQLRVSEWNKRILENLPKTKLINFEHHIKISSNWEARGWLKNYTDSSKNIIKLFKNNLKVNFSNNDTHIGLWIKNDKSN